MLQTKDFLTEKIMLKDRTIEDDTIVVEEPLSIFLRSPGHGDKQLFSITMRTPGADRKLVAGLLFSEGLAKSIDDIQSIDHCHKLSQKEFEASSVRNSILVDFASKIPATKTKNLYSTVINSACGVCGATFIQNLSDRLPKNSLNEKNEPLHPDLIQELPNKIYSCQSVFQKTGGIHAAALFNLTGELIALHEDVGRHNAVDKIVGEALLENRLPLAQTILLMSSRLSYEIVQKAVLAGIKIIAAIGAPTSMAIEIAQDFDITLVGFLRNNRFNIYSHPQRIKG